MKIGTAMAILSADGKIPLEKDWLISFKSGKVPASQGSQWPSGWIWIAGLSMNILHADDLLPPPKV